MKTIVSPTHATICFRQHQIRPIFVVSAWINYVIVLHEAVLPRILKLH